MFTTDADGLSDIPSIGRKYQNRRGDYLNAWWHVINWHTVAQRFERVRG